MTVIQLLLLLSGDVELNPGPPKRGSVTVAKKEPDPPKVEEKIGTLETKVNELVILPKIDFRFY